MLVWISSVLNDLSGTLEWYDCKTIDLYYSYRFLRAAVLFYSAFRFTQEPWREITLRGDVIKTRDLTGAGRKPDLQPEQDTDIATGLSMVQCYHSCQ